MGQIQAGNIRCLVADIGGTNLRVAVAETGALKDLQTFASEAISDPGQALADYTKSACDIRHAVLAVAGPVENGRFSLTNRDWSSSADKLSTLLGLERVVLVNDFAAVAHSVTGLTKNDLVPVRDGTAEPDGNVLVCGPGTGFGVSVLVRPDEFTIATEAGHMQLGATNEEEFDAFVKLRREQEPLAIEHVLSGRGIAALDHALNDLQRAPAEIATAGNKHSGRTLRMFMNIFGRVVGDLALAFDARGGIFIGGGLGPALHSHYAMPEFHAAYEAHAPYGDRLRKIPISLIAHPYPGLIGAAQIARRLLAD